MPHTPNAAAGFPHHHQEGPQPAPEHPFPQLGAVEHIGIAVPSLADALPLWEALLGVREYKREAVPREGVVTSFLRTGDTKIELLESTNETGPIGKFLAKRGPGIHHVAFHTADIVAEMARLHAAGFTLLSDAPQAGADGKLVCFLHPKGTTGVLVELCQPMP